MKSLHLTCLILVTSLFFPFTTFSAAPGVEGYRTQRPMQNKVVQSGIAHKGNYSKPVDHGTRRDEVAESDERTDNFSRSSSEANWVKEHPSEISSKTIAIRKKSQPFHKSSRNIVPNRPAEAAFQPSQGPEYREYVCQPETVPYEEGGAYVGTSSMKTFVIPAAVLAGGVAAGSASAVSNSGKNNQSYSSEPPLDFTMQVTLDTSEGPATFEMEILYPNSTVFYDWLVSESTGIIVETSTSPSTVNYFPGDQFTVVVLDGVRASNFSISGRINGVVFETQTIATPAYGNELIFTIP